MRSIQRNQSVSATHRDEAQQGLKRLAVLGLVCAVVIGVYAWIGYSCPVEPIASGPRDNNYNLLVRGFREGQLNLKREVPSGLTDSDKPAIVDRSQVTGVNDLSYYKGKLYLYFGATPALALFWPCVALTGHYLSKAAAVVIFFSAGFLGGWDCSGRCGGVTLRKLVLGRCWRGHWRWDWPILRRR